MFLKTKSWRRLTCLASISLLIFGVQFQLRAQDYKAKPADTIKALPGFEVEHIYTVPQKEQGSWVSMTLDTKGRFIVSDQYGKLYRVTVPIGDKQAKVAVEAIDLDIGHAQGLLYAFDSLYVVVNSKEHQGRGLYRVEDTNNDDSFDKVSLLKKFEESGGEHGPHAVVLGPDKKSLYIVVGNQTSLPRYDHSFVPPIWGEDLLLPRIYGRGFMRGTLAPRGWIAKTDPEGENWEIIATGFRNEYDAAFNRDGELFTFDADMEWDINTPWYRPTRVNHVVKGAEFGWRNGSGKWPHYYADSLPATVDIGPGSPTGVTFGYGAKFPAKYQNAFYICDWSYGKLYAVHLEEDGSTYSGTFEEFVSGSPLPLTDLVVHPEDGALYFAVGGRRTQSGLYRVVYRGDQPTAESQPMVNAKAKQARSLRESLEFFQRPGAPQVGINMAWKHLASDDRFLRSAARTVLEHQPMSKWRRKLNTESDINRKLAASLALARVGSRDIASDNSTARTNLQNLIFNTLAGIDFSGLSQQQKLEALRIYAVAIVRLGEPADRMKSRLARQIKNFIPSLSREINSEVLQLLVYLQDKSAAAYGVKLLSSAPSQQEQIDYAKSLRLLETGWTTELRREYFSWFPKSTGYRGGASFTKFVESIRNDAIKSLGEGEKELVQDILDKQPEAKNPLQIMAESLAGRSFVKEWSLEELSKKAETGLKNRDFENGRKMFGSAGCYACHRFGLDGGAVGPDLTGAGGRFSAHDLLESTIHPEKEVSDQYAQVIITLDNDDLVIGRIANLSGDNLSVITNMLDPGNMTGVNRSKIVSIEPSQASMMPPGLLNLLKEEEIMDLLAYLLSGGDQNHPMFK